MYAFVFINKILVTLHIENKKQNLFFFKGTKMIWLLHTLKKQITLHISVKAYLDNLRASAICLF